MTTFYLVRHGQTQYNIDMIMQGWSDSPLTCDGIAQAKKASEHLKDIPFKCVVSSDLKRTKDTADILAAPHQPIQISYDSRLREVCFGKYDGGPIENVPIQEYRSRIEMDWKSLGGENYTDVGLRFKSCLDDLVKQYPYDTILIVTHGGALVSLMKVINHDLYDNLVETKNKFKNCSTTILKYSDNYYHYELINDDSYM